MRNYSKKHIIHICEIKHSWNKSFQGFHSKLTEDVKNFQQLCGIFVCQKNA